MAPLVLAKGKGKKIQKRLVWADEVGEALTTVGEGIDGELRAGLEQLPGSSKGHLGGKHLIRADAADQENLPVSGAQVAS